LTALVAALLVGSTAALAQVQSPSLTLAPDAGPAGSSSVANGSGFPGAVPVSIHWGGPGGPVVATDTTDASGGFATSFTVPATAAPGAYTVSACVPDSATGDLCQPRADDQFSIPSATTTTTVATTTTTVATTTTTVASTTTTVASTTTTVPSTTTSSEPVSETTTTTLGLTDTTIGGDPPPPPSLKIPPGEPPGDFEAPDIEFPDIGIKALEVTQGMQDLENTMPLAAERRTVVRLHVYVVGDPWPSGMAALRAFRGGEELPTIYPVNGPITIQPQGGSRVDLDDSFWFEIPHEWTAEGDVIFEAQVWSYQPSTIWDNEPLAFNNFKEVQVSFQRASTKTVRFVPIHYHDGGGGGPTITYYATSGGNVKTPVSNTVKGLYRLHPLAGLNFLYQDSAVAAWNHCCAGGEWDLGDDDDGGKILSRLETVKWPGAKNELWVGMFHPSAKEEGVFSGLARIDKKVSWVMMKDSADIWSHAAGETLAHELGHNSGFYHANCTGTEDQTKDHPFDNPCRLATTDPDGFYGFDVYWDMFAWVDRPAVLSNDPSESDPNVAFPLMGYRNPGYPDAWAWCVLLDWYGVDCDTDTIVPAPPSGGGGGGGGTGVDTENVCKPCAEGEGLCPPKGTSGGMKLDLCISNGEEEEFSLIPSGFDQVLGVGGDAAEGELFEVVLLPPDMGDAAEIWAEQLADVARSPSAGYVEIVDADGIVITSVPIRLTDTPHDPRPGGAFVSWVPWAGTGTTLRLRTETGVVVERPISSNPPEVNLIAPVSGQTVQIPFEVEWAASDGDGDALVFDVYYSTDGGSTWLNLVSGLDDTRVTIDSLSGFGGSEDSLLRVVASDGFRSGFDTSGPMSTPNQVPNLLVVGPADGAIYQAGYPIRLEASVVDPEGAEVSVTWTSDRDGTLLEGAIGQAKSLSVGTHLVTVAATDGAGMAATVSLAVEVVPSNRSDVFSDATLTEARANFERARTEGGGPLPEIPVTPDQRDIPWIPLGVAAIALIGFGVLAGRRTGTGGVTRD